VGVKEFIVRRTALMIAVVVMSISCSSSSATVQSSPSPASPSPSPSPAAQLGPGGLTLDEEIGAVMIVGFQGPVTGAVLSDWQGRQFGGLLVVNLNHNTS
jgi:hypothetical protein